VVSQWKRNPNKHDGLDLSVDNIEVKNGGIYAVLESVEYPLSREWNEPTTGQRMNYKAHQQSQLVWWSQKDIDEQTGYPKLVVSNVSTFGSPCIAVPDHQEIDYNGQKRKRSRNPKKVWEDIHATNFFMLLRTRSQWAFVFHENAKEMDSKEAKKRSA
jgi:hypothetical protein